MNNPIVNATPATPIKTLPNYILIFREFKGDFSKDILTVLFNKYLLLFVALIFIFLWQVYDNLFDTLLIKLSTTIFSYIPNGNISSSFILFLMLSAIGYYGFKIYKVGYRPNLNFTFFILFTGIFYFSERYSGQWIFHQFYRVPHVVLIDFYWILLAGELLSWLQFMTLVRSSQPSTNKYFSLDDPTENKDEFGRIAYAKGICEYICNSFGNKALAVGISGSWGTGKSNLMDQIQKTLDKKQDKSILVIQFNPWRSSSYKRILEDFLQTIKSELNVYDKELGTKFDKYLKLLIESGKSDWLTSLTDIFSISENKSSEQLYDEINASLGRLNKKLVIFIDDLDRLHNEEIIEVFRIIRNTANFKNTCFVVAYDREYVQSSFPSTSSQMRNYIDKIFQMEFVLPNVDSSVLIQMVISEILKKVDNKIAHQLTELSLFNPDLNVILLDFIKHKRDAIRFANMFSFDLQSIYEDIDLSDFLLVELLKMKYPTIYNMLPNREIKKVAFEIKEDDSVKYYVVTPDSLKNFKEIYSEYFKIFSKNDRDTIDVLLLKLFDNSSNFSINSIKFNENFYKYFSLSVFSYDLKNSDFWKTIKDSFDEAKAKIDEWYSENDLRSKLKLLFLRHNISDFEELGHIQNYIYGMKKASSLGFIMDGRTLFHVALNTAGFTKEEFRKILGNISDSDLDDKIIELLFPEGILDPFNSIFIDELYFDGKEGNNLFSIEKCKELIISKFTQLQKEDKLDLLFDTWKTLVTGNDFKKWDDDIFRLTNDFASQILDDKENFKKFIGVLYSREQAMEKSSQNNAVLDKYTYRKEFDILKDVAEILSTKFRHLSDSMDYKTRQFEIKNRISFYRELIIDNKVQYHRMLSFLDEIGPNMLKNNDYKEYESNVLDIYPISSDKFEPFDIDLFSNLRNDFHITKL